MANEPHHIEPLSHEGTRRKEAILATAQQALTGRTRARRARRSLGAFVLLAGGAAVALSLIPRPPSPSRPREPVAQRSHETVETEKRRAIAVERLDDDAMLAALAALGVDAGLIEVDGRQTLVTREGEELRVGRTAPKPRQNGA